MNFNEIIRDIEVPTKKLNPDAHLPTKGTEDAVGMDLYIKINDTDCCPKGGIVHTNKEGKKVLVIPAGATVMCHTGIAMAIPKGVGGFVFARSGLACKQNIRPENCVGVIDPDYRGEIIVALHNDNTPQVIDSKTGSPDMFDKVAVEIEDGERIAQMVFLPYLKANITEVDELDDTERGAGGFGSTGKT